MCLKNVNSHIMTSSNENIFRVTGPLYGEFTGHRLIPLTKPVTRSFDVFFHLRLNKRLNKQSRRAPAIWDIIVLIMTSL